MLARIFPQNAYIGCADCVGYSEENSSLRNEIRRTKNDLIDTRTKLAAKEYEFAKLLNDITPTTCTAGKCQTEILSMVVTIHFLSEEGGWWKLGGGTPRIQLQNREGHPKNTGRKGGGGHAKSYRIRSGPPGISSYTNTTITLGLPYLM